MTVSTSLKGFRLDYTVSKEPFDCAALKKKDRWILKNSLEDPCSQQVVDLKLEQFLLKDVPAKLKEPGADYALALKNWPLDKLGELGALVQIMFYLQRGNQKRATDLIRGVTQQDPWIKAFSSATTQTLKKISDKTLKTFLKRSFKFIQKKIEDPYYFLTLVFYWDEFLSHPRFFFERELELSLPLNKIRELSRSYTYGKLAPALWYALLRRRGSAAEALAYLDWVQMYLPLEKRHYWMFEFISKPPEKNRLVFQKLSASSSFYDQHLFFRLKTNPALALTSPLTEVEMYEKLGKEKSEPFFEYKMILSGRFE